MEACVSRGRKCWRSMLFPSGLLVLTVLAVAPARLEARRPISASTRCGVARVAISVSPIVRSKELRTLELSWSIDDAKPGDQVALYDYDPVARRQWDSARSRNEPVSDAGDQGTSREPYSTPGSRGSFAPLPPTTGAAAGPRPSASNPYDPYAPFPATRSRDPTLADIYNSNGPYNPNSNGPFTYNNNGPFNYNGYVPYSGSPAPGREAPAPPAPPPTLFPIGYPRDAFGGRARRQDQPEDGPPLAVVSTEGLRSGWRSTGVQERHVPSAQLGYTPRCLNYWAVYERPVAAGVGSPEPRSSNDTEVLAVTCLRTRPTWMSDFRTEIGRLRLVDLFIPGTHDSASIREDGRNNFIDRYTVTQDESILGQLIYGVRYIDLRVGFYSNKDVQWWANHGPVRMMPLMSVLHDIKAFLDNTNEIVILDVQNFPSGFGKDNKIHLKLVHLLETELGEVMAYRDQGQVWRSRLEDVWTSGRRLIVAYDKEDVLPESRKLWPAVRQFWGDAQTPEQLNSYAASILSQQYLQGFGWALMAELTPNARLIATNPTGSLRRLAHLVNRNVTAWAEGAWGEVMNTLAVDFVRSTGVVEAALWHNLRRGGVDVCTAYRLLESV